MKKVFTEKELSKIRYRKLNLLANSISELGKVAGIIYEVKSDSIIVKAPLINESIKFEMDFMSNSEVEVTATGLPYFEEDFTAIYIQTDLRVLINYYKNLVNRQLDYNKSFIELLKSVKK